MKRILIFIFAMLAFSTVVMAQTEGDARAISMPKSENLSPFSKVVVEGSVSVIMRRIEGDETLKISYEQLGGALSRFRVGVDRNGVLTISENRDAEQSKTLAEAILWYKDIESLTVTGSTVLFEDVVSSPLLDISVRSKAAVVMSIDALDLQVECTGNSALTIGGTVRYLDLNISTATFEGFDLQTVAARIDASHSAAVALSVSERLEAITSTSAKLYYKGEPTILRTKNSLFGGDISAVK